jgi:hypothetical protein
LCGSHRNIKRLKQHSDESILIVILLKEDYILYIEKISTAPRVSHNTEDTREKKAPPAGTLNEECAGQEREKKPLFRISMTI